MFEVVFQEFISLDELREEDLYYSPFENFDADNEDFDFDEVLVEDNEVLKD
jgi:hypothetical protein